MLLWPIVDKMWESKVTLHPPSAFDMPNHIIANLRILSGLLRQRLRY
jgi:hypothetical protein